MSRIVQRPYPAIDLRDLPGAVPRTRVLRRNDLDDAMMGLLWWSAVRAFVVVGGLMVAMAVLLG